MNINKNLVMNINKNLTNRNVTNDQMSSNSCYTANSSNETIFLVSFYDTVALDNRNYFDNNYDMVMSKNKPFICCSTLTFNSQNIQQADIYVGEGTTRPWAGYVINQKLAAIIAHSLNDAWTNKDTFNSNYYRARVEQENMNLVLDKNLKLDNEVKKKINNGELLTEADVQRFRKSLSKYKYYRVSRMYNGQEYIVYVSYDTICDKCKDALKNIRTNQKNANSTNYTEETTSTNLGTTLKTSQMMIELDRVKYNFGDTSYELKRNPQFQKWVENIIKFLMKKKLNKIYVIDGRQLRTWDTSTFLNQFAGANIQAKYRVDNNTGLIVQIQQQQNMQNNIINVNNNNNNIIINPNIINVSGSNKSDNNEDAKDKRSSRYGKKDLKGSTIRSSRDEGNLKSSRGPLDNNDEKSQDKRSDKAGPERKVRNEVDEPALTHQLFLGNAGNRRNNRYAGNRRNNLGITNQTAPYMFTERRDAYRPHSATGDRRDCCNCCKFFKCKCRKGNCNIV